MLTNQQTSGGQLTPKVWKLSPSDFGFLWDDCKRCFYLKHVKGFQHPKMPFPGVFSKIAGMQKRFFDQKETAELIPNLPKGVFLYGEKFVRSIPIFITGRSTACFISGRFDTVVRFEDDSYGVIDFKTADPKESNTAKYDRQLHAYAYALLHPAEDSLALSPISSLGLLVLDPAEMVLGQRRENYYIKCNPKWIPFDYSEENFLKFVDEVLGVLELQNTPQSSPDCEMCAYRHAGRRNGY